MPTSLALSLIPKQDRPSPGNIQFRASIMEFGSARLFGINSIHNKPTYMCRLFRAWFFLWIPIPWADA